MAKKKWFLKQIVEKSEWKPYLTVTIPDTTALLFDYALVNFGANGFAAKNGAAYTIALNYQTALAAGWVTGGYLYQTTWVVALGTGINASARYANLQIQWPTAAAVPPYATFYSNLAIKSS